MKPSLKASPRPNTQASDGVWASGVMEEPMRETESRPSFLGIMSY